MVELMSSIQRRVTLWPRLLSFCFGDKKGRVELAPKITVSIVKEPTGPATAKWSKGSECAVSGERNHSPLSMPKIQQVELKRNVTATTRITQDRKQDSVI